MILPHGRPRQSFMESALVDSKLGVVKALSTLMNSAHDPTFFVSITDISRTNRISPFLGGISSTGVGLTAREASNIALGEAMEDYCASYIQNDLIHGTWQELSDMGLNALHPQEHPLFSITQYKQPSFRFKPFTTKTPLRWVKYHSLQNQTEKYIPAAFTYCAYIPQKNEMPICPTMYAGIGCGQTKDKAYLAALCEIIERDAMMIWWLNQLPCKRCIPAPGSWLDKIIKKHIAPSRLIFELWDIGTDIKIPCLFGLLTDPYNKIVSGGFACRPNTQAAAVKAFSECLQNRLGVLSFKNDSGVTELNTRLGAEVLQKKDAITKNLTKKSTEFKTMDQLNMNLQFYTDPNNIALLETVRSSNESIELPPSTEDPRSAPPEKDLAACIEALSQNNFKIFTLDITLPEIKEIGLFVVRVLVPGMIPNSATAFPFLGNQRLYDIPEQLGFPRKLEKDMEVAPMPYG